MILIYAFWTFFTLLMGIFYSTWITALGHIGLPLGDATLSYAYFILGQVLLELPTGYLADRWGRKRTTITGVVLYGFAFAGIFFDYSSTLVYAFLVLAGFGHTMISGAHQAWVIDIAERKAKLTGGDGNNRRLFLSLDLVRRVNLALGAAVGAYFLGHYPRLLWAVLATLSAVAATVAAFAPADDVQASLGKVRIELGRVWANLKDPQLLGVLAMGLFYGIETGNRDTIMQPYVVNFLGHGNPYGMVVIQGGVGVIGIVGNRLAAAWRRKHQNGIGRGDIALLTLPLVVMGVAQSLAPGASTLLQFALLYFTGMICIGWFYPTQTFFLTTLIKKEHRAFLLSGASMVECLMQAATCIFVSRRINEVPLNEFWSIGGGACFVAAVAVVIGLVLPRLGGRQASEQGGMTQLTEG